MSDDGTETNWTHVIAGVVMLVLAIVSYVVITKMESSGGSYRINAIFALFYKILGKWGLVGLLALFGLGGIWVGFSPPRGDD